VLTTEVLLWIKYHDHYDHLDFSVDTPIYIWAPWATWLVSMTCFWLYLRFKPGHTTKYPLDLKIEDLKMNIKKIL